MDRPAPHPVAIRRLAHLLAAAGLILEIAAIAVLATITVQGTAPPLDGNTTGGYALAATFTLVGWIVASRRPANAIGWIFLVIGLSQALATFASMYSGYGPASHTSPLPFAAELSWAGVWAWAPGYVLLLTLSVLLFPDGRLPSPRWRPLVWLVAASLVLIIGPMAIAAWPVRGLVLETSQPPYPAVPALATAITVQGIGLLLAAFAAVGSVLALVGRFRRSRGVERHQLKWFTFAGAVEIGLIAGTPFVQFGTMTAPASALLALLVAPLLPIAAAIAILHYRLYEIDRIVSRTISYSAVTAVLGSLFVAVILVLQAALASVTSGGPIAVAASTLVVASLFQPVRRRIQSAVDRRFDRSRYDAERTLAAFAGRLRDNVDLANLSEDIQSVVTRTVAPAAVGVWIRRIDHGS
jgi:hypothetical protein